MQTPGSFLVAEAHPAAGRTELVEWRPTAATTATLGSSATYSRHSLLPAPYSVGTDVHSYGGGSFAPLSATRVVLSDERVHGVWALQLLPQSAAATGQQPATDTTTTTTTSTTTTPSLIEIVGGDDNVAFADFAPFPSSSSSPDLVVCVREDRRGHPPGHADNTLVLIDLTRRGDDAVTPLLAPGTTAAAAADFYSHPRFSPDGAYLSWLQWAHPDMPWTGAQLMVAPFDRVSGRLAAAPRHVAGAANKESCVQPSWSPVVAPAAAVAPGCDHHQPQRSRLWFVCDRSRFWQLYTYDPVSALPPEPVVLPGLELGEFASPAWTLAPQTLAFLTPTTLVAAWTANATEQLVLISAPADGRPPSWSPLGLPLTNIRNAALAATSPTSFAVLAATVRSPPAVFAFDVTTRRLTVVASSAPEVLGKESVSRAVHLSVPRTTAAAVTIPTSGHDAPDPDVDNHTHLFFFPPRNARFVGIPGTLPPLIVRIHDGPTSHAGPALSLHNQYLTSRGFAVAVVNPAGSSGYGRAYRDMLDGLWGVLDIADVLECASYLAKKGYVDGNRVGVTGESSGGYVTLCVVAAAAAAAKQSSSSYAARISAAVSTAGISDLALLATQTHKFESRYLDRLLFTPNAIPTDPAVRTAVYHARSPRVTLASNSGPAPPLLLLQGTADVIVPPEQASALAKDMAAVGRWVHLVTFDGEGHGWPRRADHRRRALAEADEWWGEYLVGPARRANDEKEKGTGGGLIESFLGPLRSVVRPEDAAAGKVPVRAFVALSVVGAFPMVVRWVGWWLGDGPRSK